MARTTTVDDDIHSPHARVYRTLGTLYLTRPTTEFVEQIRTWATEWLDTEPSPPPAIREPLETIQQDETSADDLRSDFTRLFRGISESDAVDPPYESLYRDGQLYGSTAIEVQRGYRSAGFETAAEESNELPDHVGIELEFLGELCELRERDAELSAGRIEDAIEWLLDEHLTVWLPQLQARVHEADPPPFYEGVVDLTVAIVEVHHREQVAERS